MRAVFDPVRRYIDTDDLVKKPDENAAERKSQLDEACEFLEKELADGPKSSKEVEAAAEDAGIKKRTLERARERLGVKSVKLGGGGPWRIELPHKAQRFNTPEAA